VRIERTQRNLVGGLAPGTRNVISGNGVHGVFIFGAGALGNAVQGNYIGTNAGGTGPLGNGVHGVVLDSAPSNLVGGTSPAARNVISGNRRHGVVINLAGASGNVVQGNFVGTDAMGMNRLGNGEIGIVANSAGNLIGGTAAGAGNLVSANGTEGITLADLGATGNRVEGNLIGTDRVGTGDLGNSGSGVLVSGPGNLIGGATPGARNVISGNQVYGVLISEAVAANNVVRGNFIGTDISGTAAVGNSLFGVLIDRSNSNVVGGREVGEGNRIAFNGSDGIAVLGGIGNALPGNAIYANAGLGIDLGDDGVTPNDPGDVDSGPNLRQNAPILAFAADDGTATTIQGTLNSTPNSLFRVEFFASPAADPSGFGEGETYLGFIDVTTGPDGNASFVFVPAGRIGLGQAVTATATDASGNTSEFSRATSVAPAVADVSARVRVDRGGFSFNRRTGRFLQQVTITNTSAAPIIGPISLVLDDLSTNATLLNRTGTTRRVGRTGSPYIDVPGDGSLGVGQSVTILLEFDNPSLRSISYSTRVLAGAGER